MGVPAKKIFAAAQSSPTARACCGAKRSPTKASTRFARVDAAVATGTLDGPGRGFDPDTMDDSFDLKMLMPPMKHSCNSARVLKRVAPTTVARADGLADAFGDIGKRIKVRFNLKRKPGVKRFYNGTIVDYDKESRSHTIAYDDGDLTKYPSLKKKTFQISAAPASAIPATPEVEPATAQASEGPEATLLLAQDRGTWDDGDTPCFDEFYLSERPAIISDMLDYQKTGELQGELSASNEALFHAVQLFDSYAAGPSHAFTHSSLTQACGCFVAAEKMEHIRFNGLDTAVSCTVPCSCGLQCMAINRRASSWLGPRRCLSPPRSMAVPSSTVT